MKLMVEVNGETVPLADCFWVHYAPTGCAVGSMLGELAVNAEQAHRELTIRGRDRDRDRETRQGYRLELVTREQWSSTVQPCMTRRCEHRSTT